MGITEDPQHTEISGKELVGLIHYTNIYEAPTVCRLCFQALSISESGADKTPSPPGLPLLSGSQPVPLDVLAGEGHSTSEVTLSCPPLGMDSSALIVRRTTK